MTKHIFVAGAGYAGLTGAGRLARRTDRDDVQITLINPVPHFVQRIRMHQLASGQQVATPALTDVLAGTGVQVRLGRIAEIDADRNAIVLDDGSRHQYDFLLNAIGSTAAVAAEKHLEHVASEPAAARLQQRLRQHTADDGPVVVVGGGLTGLEIATEVAESRPDLHVTIVSDPAPGAWLSDKGRRHLTDVFERLGMEVITGSVTITEPGRVELADGSVIPAGITVWATGFAAHPLAAASDLQTTDSGLVVVDNAFRSVSHADVVTFGDTAFAMGPGDKPLRMSCASGQPSSWRAVDALVTELTGHRLREKPLRYIQQNISLGRRDGIVQFVTADDTTTSSALIGRKAAWVKEMVCRTALWGVKHPIGYPVRRRRLDQDVVSSADARG